MALKPYVSDPVTSLTLYLLPFPSPLCPTLGSWQEFEPARLTPILGPLQLMVPLPQMLSSNVFPWLVLISSSQLFIY